MKLAWIITAFVCGALLPLQAGLNARLGKSIDSPIYASLISFIVGALAVAIYLPFARESVSWTGLKSASLYSWLGGGIIGAFFYYGFHAGTPPYRDGAHLRPGGSGSGHCVGFAGPLCCARGGAA